MKKTSNAATPRPSVLHEVAEGYREPPEIIFKRGLSQRGLKYTTERRAILEAVLSLHDHFDAERLLYAMQASGAKTSRATIYRSLVLLCEMGLLREAYQGKHGATFEHVYGHSHHEHLICLSCGKVLEFHSPQLERLQENACRAANFQSVQHHLHVFGYCSACRKKP